ncbi:serine/threonine-protein kinase-like protein [Acrodontium crateriforme]|uniref:non-specific serine/threonine protein kinase n=1 Tax=Acrodontium crateriforme TaxID=150365 RepID=A0AAQ3MBA0_9PEZI|nr:serine/threonine-protein kinase-like protein [Acrodontium crateriforme]
MEDYVDGDSLRVVQPRTSTASGHSINCEKARLPDDIDRRDLSPLYESFSIENDEHGNPIFLHSSYGYIAKDFSAFYGCSNKRKYDLTPTDLRETLKCLPDDDVYPEAPFDITKMSTTIHDKIFVKGPMLHDAFQNTGQLPQLTLGEVKVLELLAKNPHPNIARYHGCLIERGRIVGIAFDRLSRNLFDRVKQHDTPFDGAVCMASITSAVEYIHSLGLAHNDLNPSNIMLDEADTAFIIDFGSCRPEGEDLITTGTHGWIDEDFTTSAQDHDYIALRKIKAWLETEGRNCVVQPDVKDF